MLHQVSHSIPGISFTSSMTRLTATVKFIHHFLSRSQVSGKAAIAACCVTALAPLVNCPCNFSQAFATSALRRDIPETVTRHGIPFTQAVDDDNTVFYLAELCNAFMPADEIDILIDLIGNNINVRMLLKYISKCF